MGKCNTQGSGHFSRLFAQYQQRFIHFAYSYVADYQLAEDFVADAFMIYWEKRSDLDPETNSPAYILTIIKNKCLNYLEHKRIKLRVEKDLTDHALWLMEVRVALLEACDPDELFSKDIQQIVSQTLDSLPQKTRKIFEMSRLEGLSHKEIAITTGISTKGVEYQVSKALKILRLALNDYLPILIFLLLV